MHTATFYSYRGGVGRTTALVNVGIDLALRGRKVLLVDFDLEAPSLPSFAHLRPDEGTHPGLVEFVAEYLRSGKAPDIRNYVYQAKPIGENCAEVWVMPAGRCDDDYWRALHGIDWKKLYDLQDGFVLFEDVKFQWQDCFHPDYVLVDARAGINDRLAICTRQLPDAVVMVFTPDSCGEAGAGDQGGVQHVTRDIFMESVASGPRRINLIFVASKVPDLDGEEPNLHDLLAVDETVSFDLAAAIPHAPELLLDRQIIPSLYLHKQPLGMLYHLGDIPLCPLKRLPRAFRNLANRISATAPTRPR